MHVIELLGKNAAAIIAVIGTILGALVAGLSSWLQKKAEWGNQRKLRRLERSMDFEERYLIRPIIEYLETELQVLQRIYSKGVEKDDAVLSQVYQEHHWEMLLTEARVRVYGDKQLVDKFAEFTRDRIAIGTFVLDPKEKDISKGYSALREAEGRAAEILAALKNRLSNIEN